MAGHSHSANIKHRKNAQDAKRAKLFTKLQRAVFTAAKTGDDPSLNPTLRVAISKARAMNLPKDKIDAAIKRASSNDLSDSHEDFVYIAHFQDGICIVIEGGTNNKNRSASEVRAVVSKYSGNIGDPSSLSFLFTRMGVVSYPKDSVSDFEEFFEASITGSADSVEESTEEDESTGEVIPVFTAACQDKDFAKLRDTLLDKYSDYKTAELRWFANSLVEASEEVTTKIQNIISALHELDDVITIYSNLK